MTRRFGLALLAMTFSLPTTFAQQEFEVPASIEREGWTILSARRRAPTRRGKSTRLKRAAKSGGPLEKLALGDAYAYGCHYYASIEPDITGAKNAIASALFSIDRDRDKGEAWYRKAIADGGLALPLVRLGDLLLVRAREGDPGASPEARRAEALQLYRRAAEVGSPEGMVKLGDALRLAGEPESVWRPWYERAAHDPVYPNLPGRLRLTDLLLDEGRGAEALALFDERFPGQYGEHALIDYAPEGVFEAYVQARILQFVTARAEQGDPEAMLRRSSGFYLTLLTRELNESGPPAIVEPSRYAEARRIAQAAYLAEGTFLQPSPTKVDWVARAAEAGQPEAQFRMGNRAQRSHEDPQPEALRWYRLAADAGHDGARERLAEFRARLDAQAAESAELKGLIDGVPQ